MFFISLLGAQITIIDFSDIVDNLDYTKKTSLFAKNYWNNIAGQEVTWNGVVKNVKGNKRSARIFVANDERPTYKGFNIVLYTKDVDMAGTLEIGQRIEFNGLLDNYKSKKGGSSVIYLKDVILSSGKPKTK